MFFDLVIFLNEYYTIYDIPMYRFLQRGTIYGNFLVSDAEGKKIIKRFNQSYYRIIIIIISYFLFMYIHNLYSAQEGFIG